MKLVKSLLLGSAAGLFAVAGVQAADLPVRKAAPVEYVRVCTTYGAGYFYIPGTDTCLRVGGRARFEYQYTSARTRADLGGFRATGRIQLDARTQTAYGTLRTFVRLEIASRTGAYLTSGTGQRYASSFFATGQDTFGRDQKYVEVDKAFIQFAGFTAGRSASMFDFYAHDVELIGSSVGSDASSTNLLAYTATFGSGFSATVSMEDPIFRRNPVYASSVTTIGASGTSTGSPGNIILGSSSFSTVNVYNTSGAVVGSANLDVAERNQMPDFVAALRYDQAWGSLQASGAVHEIITGGYLSNTAPNLATTVFPKVPDSKFGYGAQAGAKINMPFIAPGDVLWLQAAYAKGAGDYTGIFSPQGRDLNSSNYTGKSAFSGADAAVDLTGRMHLTESFSGTVAFLHYWTPEVRSGFFGSAGRAHFDNTLRGVLSPVAGIAGAPLALSSQLNGLFKDYINVFGGANILWSPVRDLDLGLEADYERLEYLGKGLNKRAYDLTKASTKTSTFDDNVLIRAVVRRDF